ncbi:MAG: CapA family protein [Anaerolineae bacterium]|nr:CapA family protein [Anaerolineae bacterium]
MRKFFGVLLLIILGTMGCRGEPVLSVLPTLVSEMTLPPPPTPVPLDEILPTLWPTATAWPSPTPTAPPAPWVVRVTDGLPDEIVAAALHLTSLYPDRFAWTAPNQTADLRLTVAAASQPPASLYPLAVWHYAVAAPFNRLTDGLTTTELTQLWQNGELVVTGDAAALLTTLYGHPSRSTIPTPTETIAQTSWATGQFAVLPFHHLTPDLKVIRLDGAAPIDLEFNPTAYPLRLLLGVEGSVLAVNQFRAVWAEPAANWDRNKISTIAMTGVTGTGRAVGYQMELRGVTFPGEAIAPLMNGVDIAHLSHEIPFAPDCPYPDPSGGTTFCADDRYLELLTSLGIDVVEMTGNHINDWGEPNLQHTFDLYESVGMRWFGGGRDLAQAQQPLLWEHHGNRIAFVGCNPVGPYYAWARENYGGSNPCTSYQEILAQISQLKAEGYVVIATLQYWEHYSYYPTAQQRIDFRAFAEAGAAAVSGSQGHHAMGFAFHQGAFIHYGLGNLIFDQPQMLGTQQTFIDVYTLYDGRLLNVDLWTGMIEYWSRPRSMTPAEREQLLRATFQASDWE